MLDLELVDTFGDFDDLLLAMDESFGKLGLRVGFLLEDKSGEEGDDFFGFETAKKGFGSSVTGFCVNETCKS